MLTKPMTIAEAIATHEATLRDLHALVKRNPEEGLRQLIPTGSFWLWIGSIRLGTVVSLLEAPSGGSWEANSEHWFGTTGIDFAEVFGTKDDLEIAPFIHCGTVAPCPSLLNEMNELAAGWSADFQMYAKGVLAPADWSGEPPELGNNLYAFEAKSEDPARPRMVFDVNENDPKKLDRIVWLSDDEELSTYPLEKLVLKYVGDSLPEAKYYYTASR